MDTNVYTCTDGHGVEEIISASCAESAAAEYVAEGDWPAEPKTYWIDIATVDADGTEERWLIPVNPTAPTCPSGDHEWGEVSTRASGGGVVFHETCEFCALEKITDTWAQCSVTGRQGLDSIEYRTNEY